MMMTETHKELQHHIIEEHGINCEHCEFETKSKVELKRHMVEEHTHYCDRCNFTLMSKLKLKNHICKVTIQNPTFGFWIPYNLIGKPVKEGDVRHFKLNCFVKNREVLWPDLIQEMKPTDIKE